MNWLTARYETLVGLLERKHHFPWVLTSGCCSHEIQNAGLATYDWQRLGADNVASDPREANVLLVAGWINSLRAEEIKLTYAQMRRPTYVIAIGACALSGSPYDLGEEKFKPITAGELVPVDIFVPGCPPHPEVILSALIELQRKTGPRKSDQEILREALRS